VQHLLPQILAQAPMIQNQILARVQANLHRLSELTRGTSVSVLVPQGGWSAIVRTASVRSESEQWRALCAGGLWVAPGDFYALPFESAFVLSLLPLPEVFERAVNRFLEIENAH
jgi:hypothetical protein